MNFVKRPKIAWVFIITLILYWIFDSVMDVFLFEEQTLAEQLFSPNGSEIYMRLSVVAFFVLVIHLRSTIAQLNNTKQEEKEACTRLNQLVHLSPSGIDEIDKAGTILFANDSYHTLHGYAPGELIGVNIEVLISEKEKAGIQSHFTSILRDHPEPEPFQVQHVKKNGTRFDLEVHWNYKYDEKQEVTGFVCVVTDITSRKEAEKKMEKALVEKGVLLKEIHHRVKNNLQIIGSLLFLQASVIEENGGGRAKFKEARERVQTMAFVHELLYKSGNLDKIQFKSYVDHLVKSLMDAYSVDESKVNLSINVEDFSLGIDLAIPCGLILNELVTNVFKHAFPENKKGVLHLDIEKIAGDQIEMVVRDNGIGLPEGCNLPHGNTLGLRLVSLLVEQIEAELIIKKSEGTSFQIRFREI